MESLEKLLAELKALSEKTAKEKAAELAALLKGLKS